MQSERVAKAGMQDAAEMVARVFVDRVAADLDIRDAFLFGSRARRDARTDSDLDVAIVLNGERRRLTETVLHLSTVAYDLFTETGVLIDAHPLWAGEWDVPATCPNPSLVEGMKKDSLRL